MRATVRIATVVVALVVLGYSTTGALAQDVTLRVDADASGNSATSLGSIQNCRSVNTDDTFDVDVVITDVKALAAFQFELQFDPDILQVTAANDKMMLAATPGSNIIPFTDTPPGKTSGSFLVAAADFGQAGKTEENGSGVLARLTFKALANGLSSLSIYQPELAATGPDGNTFHIEPVEGSYFVGPIYSANIAVGQSCTPPPSPTSHPSATTDGTPTPGATPGATPGEAATPGEPASENATPGITPSREQQTAVAGATAAAEATAAAKEGTPGSIGSPGAEAAGGDQEDGGGLSTTAWVGIGVGIAVAALAAGGGGWRLLRRRRGAP